MIFYLQIQVLVMMKNNKIKLNLRKIKINNKINLFNKKQF